VGSEGKRVSSCGLEGSLLATGIEGVVDALAGMGIEAGAGGEMWACC
jgi:hypothetical protein